MYFYFPAPLRPRSTISSFLVVLTSIFRNNMFVVLSLTHKYCGELSHLIEDDCFSLCVVCLTISNCLLLVIWYSKCSSVPKHLPSCVDLLYTVHPVEDSSRDWTSAVELLHSCCFRISLDWVPKAAFLLLLDGIM